MCDSEKSAYRFMYKISECDFNDLTSVSGHHSEFLSLYINKSLNVIITDYGKWNNVDGMQWTHFI